MGKISERPRRTPGPIERVWLNVMDASKYISVSDRTLRRWMVAGTIKSYRIGRHPTGPVLINRDDLDDLVRSREISRACLSCGRIEPADDDDKGHDQAE